MTGYRTKIAPGMIKTWAAIADYLGVSQTTAINWTNKHGLPVAPLPGGMVATSPALLDAWIAARAKLENERRKARKQARAEPIPKQ